MTVLREVGHLKTSSDLYLSLKQKQFSVYETNRDFTVSKKTNKR